MNKIFYHDGCTLIDSRDRKVVGRMVTEAHATRAAASLNACLGLELNRLEELRVLPLFLEMRRLTETLAESQLEVIKLRENVRDYEKALMGLSGYDSQLGVSAL